MNAPPLRYAPPGTLELVREGLEACDRHDVDGLSIIAVLVSRYGGAAVYYWLKEYVRRVNEGLPQGMVEASPAVSEELLFEELGG